MAVTPWILLAYKVPPEPAKKRIALWRKIKTLGAVYLQNGVCLLPKTDDHVRRLKIMEYEIAEMDGDSVLLETNGLDSVQEQKLLARFNADRDEAYQEFLQRCDGFEAEIARESAAGKFTFAELEENDEDLKKLASWLEKIRKLELETRPWFLPHYNDSNESLMQLIKDKGFTATEVDTREQDQKHYLLTA
jgi:hypothetical protein